MSRLANPLILGGKTARSRNLNLLYVIVEGFTSHVTTIHSFVAMLAGALGSLLYWHTKSMAR